MVCRAPGIIEGEFLGLGVKRIRLKCPGRQQFNSRSSRTPPTGWGGAQCRATQKARYRSHNGSDGPKRKEVGPRPKEKLSLGKEVEMAGPREKQAPRHGERYQGRKKGAAKDPSNGKRQKNNSENKWKDRGTVQWHMDYQQGFYVENDPSGAQSAGQGGVEKGPKGGFDYQDTQYEGSGGKGKWQSHEEEAQDPGKGGGKKSSQGGYDYQENNYEGSGGKR
eukprot:276703-Heterocapsa_arctica.AAC.1